MTPRAAFAAAAASARERVRYPGELLGSAAFLAILVFALGRVWLAVERAGRMPEGWSVSSLVLYLVVAEVVIMAPGAIHLRVASDVRSGDLAVQLLRPMSWVAWELARALGGAAARVAFLATVGVTLAWALHGLPRLDAPSVIVGALVLVPAAILMETTVRLALGVLAFWTEDANAFAWIWSKLCLVLGGVLMPIELYPPWLQAIARVLPFEAELRGPARAIARGDVTEAWAAGARLLAWLVLVTIGLILLHSRASRSVQLNGG